MSYELQLATLVHKNYLERDDLSDLRDECESNRDALNDEIEILEDDISDKQNDLEELEAGSNAHEMAISEIERIEKLVAEKRELSQKWDEDFKHLEDVLTSGDSAFICEHSIDDYIQDTYRECNEIPDHLQSYIDWESLTRDCKIDYSCVTIDGCEYWYR